jgi:hypothetical protein
MRQKKVKLQNEPNFRCKLLWFRKKERKKFRFEISQAHKLGGASEIVRNLLKLLKKF